MSEAAASKQFAAFLGVGGLAALANFGSRFIFGLVVGFELSVLLAFFVGLSSAFLMNRAFVFSDARETTWRVEAFRFVVVNLAGLVVTLVVAVLALQGIGQLFGDTRWDEGLAHILGLGCTAVTSYIAHSLWTFRG